MNTKKCKRLHIGNQCKSNVKIVFDAEYLRTLKQQKKLYSGVFMTVKIEHVESRILMIFTLITFVVGFFVRKKVFLLIFFFAVVGI